MKTISYYDKKESRYLYLDLSSTGSVREPTVTALPDIDGLPAQKWYSTPDGRYTYLSAFRYTLRDDMERKIRRRFFRRDNASGELREMFLKWDRSAFQANAHFFLRDGLFFMVASYTETGTNAAFMIDINEDFDGVSPKLL